MIKLRHLLVIATCLTLLIPIYSLAGKDSTLPRLNRGHLPKLVHRAERLCQSKIQEEKPEFYEWEWTAATLMIGLSEMYEISGDPVYLDYIRDWVEHHLDRGYTLSKSDQVVPGLLLLRLYKATSDPRYLEHAERIGHYVTEQALRTDEGGLIHFGPLGGKSMWIDSLFMLGPFLVELYQTTGDTRYLDEAVRQALIMYGHLQDRASGLCKHSWNESTGKTNSAHWLRGNGWALAATAIILDAIPEGYDSKSSELLRRHFRGQALGLIKHQDPGGMWHTVIDEPETYIETSGTALVAFGLIRGVDAGVLKNERLDPAHAALLRLMDYVTIHPDGSCTLSDISLGTRPGKPAYYNQVTLSENVPYGVGAYALAVSAHIRSEEYVYDPAVMRVEDGWEALSWGRVSQAREAMQTAVAMNPQSSSAHFGAGFSIMAEHAEELVDEVTNMSVGARGFSPSNLQRRLVEHHVPGLSLASSHFSKAEADTGFTQVVERLVFIGGTSFGYMQADSSEAYLLDSLCHLACAIFELFGSYNIIDAPALLIARREFGRIVQDAEYPDFLNLNDQSSELLPRARSSMAATFDKLGCMVEFLKQHPTDYPGKLISLDLLRLKGSFSLPGAIEPIPVVELISGNRFIQFIAKLLARQVPEKLPRWMEKAKRSLEGREAISITSNISLDLSAPFENPVDVRELFPEHLPDGRAVYPDPSMGGLLPGMTQKKWQLVSKFIGTE